MRSVRSQKVLALPSIKPHLNIIHSPKPTLELKEIAETVAEIGTDDRDNIFI